MKQSKKKIATLETTESSGARPVHLGQMELREWGLWTGAVIVTLLLTAGLASFMFPTLHGDRDDYSRFLIPQVVRGLVGLVLLFDIYTLYQQLLIHRIRRKLHQREELFRLISENAADLIAVVDMEGNRIYNSLSYQKVLGYSPEELKSSSSFDQIHPDDRGGVKQAAQEALHTGVGSPMEYRIRHKDGTWIVLESTASVIRNAKGDAEKLVIVNRDVTERKKAAEALKRSESSFRSVVEDAPYGIYRASLAGELLLVNPALQKMLGYETLDELVQANLASDVFASPAEHQKINALFLHDPHFKDIEVEWKRKDKSSITVRCSGRPVKNESGTMAYLEVFAEDV